MIAFEVDHLRAGFDNLFQGLADRTEFALKIGMGSQAEVKDVTHEDEIFDLALAGALEKIEEQLAAVILSVIQVNVRNHQQRRSPQRQ